MEIEKSDRSREWSLVVGDLCGREEGEDAVDRAAEDKRRNRAAGGRDEVTSWWTGSRYIGEEAGKRRAALLCAAAEAFVPAREREFLLFSKRRRLFEFARARIDVGAPIRDNADNDSR